MHGKGYRAFLNTVMVLAIVDSPILSLEEGVDDKTPDTMKAGLFKYLLDNHHLARSLSLRTNSPPALDYRKAKYD